MAQRMTKMLVLLVVVAAATTAAAVAQCVPRRDEARDAALELATLRSQLKDLAAVPAGNSNPNQPATDAPAELSGRITSAAATAGISAQLTSVEPGRPGRLENSDYNETIVFVHFAPLTLAQLAAMVDSLKAIDPRARAKVIELAAPESAETSSAGRESWKCDLTLSYLTYAPPQENNTP